MLILWALLGGVCGRIRGGLLDDWLGRDLPNIFIRSFWAAAVTALLVTKPDNYFVSPIIFGLSYLGVMWGYFGGAFDLGKPENRNFGNYVTLTARGMCIMLPLAMFMTILLDCAIWFGVAAGALFVPCYLAGNVLHRFFKIQGHTQWGEWLLYGSIMAATAGGFHG